MISNLTIKGFRAFRELRVDPLTRVNLFVGPNNAGKTTVLEAVELLASGDAGALIRSLSRRREEVLSEGEGKDLGLGREFDPSHLFHGHGLLLGRSFRMQEDGGQWVEVGFDRATLPGPESGNGLANAWLDALVTHEVLALKLTSDRSKPVPLPISRQGGLFSASIALLPYPRASEAIHFIGTETLDPFRLGQLWDEIVLTQEEPSIATALKLIEPRIERIAFVGENRRESRRVFIKLADPDRRLPLGTLGEGVGRLLGLKLHLLNSKNGYLLVDEIDTGLHFSVMSDMWKLVIETAERLDVQIFATTHSLDCVRALARVRDRYPELASSVTVHRIRQDLPTTITYDMNEIAIAARDHIEIR